MIVRQFTLIAGGVLMIAASGCVTFSARPLRSTWTASSHIQQQEISGLSIAARSLGKEFQEGELVGRPARGQGLYPLVLLFENIGDQPFLIRREGIQLETAQGQTFEAAPVQEVFESLRWSRGPSYLALPLGILPAFLLDSRVVSENREFLADLRAKAFHDIRLYKNPRQYNCLVFFRMDPDEALELKPSDCWVSVEVERQSTGDLPGEVILFRLVPQS